MCTYIYVNIHNSTCDIYMHISIYIFTYIHIHLHVCIHTLTHTPASYYDPLDTPTPFQRESRCRPAFPKSQFHSCFLHKCSKLTFEIFTCLHPDSSNFSRNPDACRIFFSKVRSVVILNGKCSSQLTFESF